VIEPDDGILAIGSGGNYALAAGRALKKYAGDHMTAAEIAQSALETAADICVYTNHQIVVEELSK
jgi:ATP-dependent HslUV protease subunit HslV